MKRIKTYILFMLCLVLSATGMAGNMRLYTSSKMSNNLVTCMTQDRHGYMWIGTWYGLNKFDGYRFNIYTYRSDDTGSLPSNIISILHTDRRGVVWVGTSNGLARYNEAEDRFERIRLTELDGQPRIQRFAEDAEGNLYVATSGFGLFEIRAGEDTARVATRLKSGGDGLYYQNLFIDSWQRCWVADNDNVITTFDLRRPSAKPLLRYKSELGIVENFVEDRKGNLYIVFQKGLMRYDGRRLTRIDDGHRDYVYRCAVRHGGDMLFGTVGHGVLRMTPDGNFSKFDDDSHGMLDNAKVGVMMEDAMHNLWVGSTEKGLVFVPDRKPLFEEWTFADADLKSRGVLSSMTKGSDGAIYATVHNECLYRTTATGPGTTAVLHLPEINHVYRDSHGQIWIGTDNRVFSFDEKSGRASLVATLDGTSVNGMADDGKGNLYVSAFTKGMCRINTATGEKRYFSMYQTNDTVRGWLCNNWIMSMTRDSRGMIWIGTTSGVSCYDPAKDTFRPYGWNVLLDGKMCMSLAEDADGNIAIGTTLGLYRYDRKTGRTGLYPGSEAMKDLQVSSIVRTTDGDLWCSTTMGIWHRDRKSGKFYSYINGNGLTGHEYIHGVGMLGDDGSLAFGTPEGVVYFDPQKITEADNKPCRPVLTNMLLNGKPVTTATLSGGRRITECPVTETDAVTISYADNSFTMEFSSFDYADIDNMVLQYRLNGGQWVSNAEGNNQLSFIHMRPGTYRLEVRAGNYGNYSDISTYRLVVRSPWYATPLAYIIYIVLFAAIITLIAYNRYRRKRIALDEEKMQFLINATHDIRTPLTLILNPLHQLMSDNKDDEEGRKKLQTIDHNARRILNLVNQILDIRKMDKQQMHLHCRETDLVQMIANNVKAFEYSAKERNIKFTFSHDDGRLMAWVDRTQFDKVVNNLLSNAFKYTFDDGEIVVRLTAADGKAVIEVSDTGTGLKDGEAERIFRRFYQSGGNAVTGNEGTGIGLNLCKMIVDMHHGEIRASNRTDTRGSIFTVAIPLGREHLRPEDIDTTTEPTERKPKPTAGNHKVLLVDDDAEITDYISTELGRYYRFGTCQNGKQAIGELLSGDYDLVVSDVMMPEMDGFTLLRMIKTNSNISHIPVILLTTEAAVANRLEGLERGADAFLPKPFILDELHATIDSLIANRQRLKGKFSGAQQQTDKVEQTDLPDNDKILMEKIMKSINKNIGDSDFGIEMLCSEVGMSRTHLHRKMKEMTGISTSEFIRNIRLEQAARLLKERHVNVSQVAYSLGFTNNGHFSKVFKQHFGVPPSEYVKDARSVSGEE